jgi:hypothetical protein
MRLSDYIHSVLAAHLGIDLEKEVSLGTANQVDYFGVSDVHGTIRVEIERRREDPLNNVVKAWRQTFDASMDDDFTLIHIFSGFYQKSKITKRLNAEFVGQRLVDWATEQGRTIQYWSIGLSFCPPRGDADPELTEEEQVEIAQEIQAQLQEWLTKA